MVGVDVGKDNLHYTWREHPEQVLACGAVRNTPGGIGKLLRRTRGDLVIEPTGRYGEALVRAARAEGREVLLAPTRRAKAALASLYPRAKTDRVDSAGLATFGLIGYGLRPYPLPSVAVDTVRQLQRARRTYSRQLASVKQQVKSLPRAAAALEPLRLLCIAQMAQLDREIAAAAALDPRIGSAARQLIAIPGFGPVVSVAVATSLIDRQFSSPDQFVAFIGLDIQVQQSGRSKGNHGLTKTGDPELRRLLFLAARAATTSKTDTQWRQRYQQLLASGMATTAATNVLARKLARVAWSIVAHGTSYSAARVGNPGT